MGIVGMYFVAKWKPMYGVFSRSSLIALFGGEILMPNVWDDIAKCAMAGVLI
jgi:hypothetical protein